MNVRLFQGVGNEATGKRYFVRDIVWPDGLQLPSRGDRVLADNEMFTVDHVEYTPGEDPQVLFELEPITDLRSNETVEEWAATYRPKWQGR